MKKYVAALIGLMVMATYASAYTVDGSLSDWGVTPFSDWVPDSSTANYVVEDYDGTNKEPGPPGYPDTPYATEEFDIEAMYFDDFYDESLGGMAYFASVVSMGPDGLKDNNGNVEYFIGDMAIDPTNDGVFEYGIKVTGPDKGLVYYKPQWHDATDIKPFSPAWFECNGPDSQVMGTADVSYQNAGVKDYPVGCFGTYGCLDNYIIEIGVKKAYIGLPEQGETNRLHITQNCGNDDIDLEITWDYQLPEFISAAVPFLVLLLVPAAAYAFVTRRKD